MLALPKPHELVAFPELELYRASADNQKQDAEQNLGRGDSANVPLRRSSHGKTMT
jgi:hypothetical protein